MDVVDVSGHHETTSPEMGQLTHELEAAREHVREIDGEIEGLLQERHRWMDEQYRLRTAITEQSRAELRAEHGE